jgi:IclR family transcriptional regulator, acetate operon repressor
MGILPAVTGTESAGGVQVIARAAKVLRALESEPQGLSLAQLAERVGLPRSTVHRIVTALAAEGLVASVSPTGRVRIGPEFARLAAGAAEFWRPVEPFMRQVHDQLGETVDCGILDGHQVRVVHVIPTTQHMLRAIADVGQSFPLYCTAKGKSLLSAMDRPTALRMLPSVLHHYTARTLTSVAAIEADLDKVTETGVAYDFEEATLGICAAAIAVRVPAGMLLTISVVVPAQRFLGTKAVITGALRQARDDALAAFSVLPA